MGLQIAAERVGIQVPRARRAVPLKKHRSRARSGQLQCRVGPQLSLADLSYWNFACTSSIAEPRDAVDYTVLPISTMVFLSSIV